MKTKLTSRFWSALLLFSLIGQVAWVVENMYFNVFIYKVFSASASDISLMVAASAVSATLTSIFIGALSDKIGKRKLFICAGYILWGISILSFAFIRADVINKLFPAAASAASVGVMLVIIMDCIMTFFGSSANDAAFNAWVTDSTDSSNRGAAEGINAMMPLVAILVVFGGFMSFNLDKAESWTAIFLIIGIVVILIGILGIFLIKEPKCEKSSDGYWSTVLYGFTRCAVRANKELYKCLLGFIIFNISIQIFMPYLIIYYEVSLGMRDYVFVMAPAIVIASAVTALWGRVYDKKGYRFSAVIALVWLLGGYALLYFFKNTALVFIGSLLMMSGYLAGMAVFGARIRDNTPLGKAGRLQGIRIFSQVFVPGIVGPFIGKSVLANAEKIIGNDGTESFVPSADIFAAAAIPAALLLVWFLLFVGKKPARLCRLKTKYEVGQIPHSCHPRPTLKREDYVNLNGEWEFGVYYEGHSIFSGKITVPFPPEAELSGVGRITQKQEILVYKRKLDIKKKSGERVLLHFGAVDNKTQIYINDLLAFRHNGGYLPFAVDITNLVSAGENTLKVIVTDSLNGDYPYGKQSLKRGGMWYTPVSGIWGTVWLEYVPKKYIEDIKITTDLKSAKISVLGGEEEKLLVLGGKSYPFKGESITVEIENPKLWSPEEPNIYEFTLSSGEDKISSYFALRTIESKSFGGKQRLCLNGKPYFFHGVLDQGYFPDGIFTPASPQAFIDDILTLKKLGFNMLRKHIKIEPELFYYYCDTLGIAVFQDMVNNGRYSFLYDTALPTAGFKRLPRDENATVKKIFLETAEQTVQRLYNHPCIVCYTIFNEGWGQHKAAPVYNRLKQLDSTRLFDTASGWFKGGPSDVQSEHVYFKNADFPIGKRPAVLSEFGGYSCSLEGHRFNPHRSYGYKVCKTTETFNKDLERLYTEEIIPLIQKGLNATVLTQLTDVEDETNGIITYDRKVTKVEPVTMQSISKKITSAFEEKNKK